MSDAYKEELENKIEALEAELETRDTFYTDLKWGTRGVNGDEEVKQVRLVDLSSDHLKNILKTQHQLHYDYMRTILLILKDRNYNEIPEDKDIARSVTDATTLDFLESFGS